MKLTLCNLQKRLKCLISFPRRQKLTGKESDMHLLGDKLGLAAAFHVATQKSIIKGFNETPEIFLFILLSAELCLINK